jgi:hypothetical protein
MASRQIVAGMLPPKPPTSCCVFGLNTMTLAAYSGMKPTKATESRPCEVPVLPAISWPAIAARVPVPAGVETSPTRILLSVLAIGAGTASLVQLSVLTSGCPSSPVSG